MKDKFNMTYKESVALNWSQQTMKKVIYLDKTCSTLSGLQPRNQGANTLPSMDPTVFIQSAYEFSLETLVYCSSIQKKCSI